MLVVALIAGYHYTESMNTEGNTKMDKAKLNQVAKIVKAAVGEHYTIGRIGGIGNAHKQCGVSVTWSHDHIAVEFGGFYLGYIVPEFGTPQFKEHVAKVRDIMAPAREALIAGGFNVEGDYTLTIDKPKRAAFDWDAALG